MTDSSTSRRQRLSVPVQVRLSPEVYDRYTDDAERQGVGVSTYLRRRLEGGDQTLDVLEGVISALQELEARLADLENARPLPSDSSASMSPNAPSSVEIETLLLLRGLLITSNRKQDIAMFQGEMRRHGISPWNLRDSNAID